MLLHSMRPSSLGSLWTPPRASGTFISRRLATHADPTTAGRLPKKKVLSLEHFLQRQRVLSLWRDVVRATNKVPEVQTRGELRSFAREEFERYRHVDDLAHIRYLLSTGKEQLKSMSRYVEQMRQ